MQSSLTNRVITREMLAATLALSYENLDSRLYEPPIHYELFFDGTLKVESGNGFLKYGRIFKM